MMPPRACALRLNLNLKSKSALRHPVLHQSCRRPAVRAAACRDHGQSGLGAKFIGSFLQLLRQVVAHMYGPAVRGKIPAAASRVCSPRYCGLCEADCEVIITAQKSGLSAVGIAALLPGKYPYKFSAQTNSGQPP